MNISILDSFMFLIDPFLLPQIFADLQIYFSDYTAFVAPSIFADVHL
jgi:hypothetical protein